MRLTVLGSCATYPGPGRACSGYLLEAGGKRIWIDQGGGTLSNLLRYASLLDLDALWLSHLHADHVSDLPLALYALRYGPPPPLPRRLPVYGPSGWGEHIERFLAGASRGTVKSVFEVNELSDGEVVKLNDLTLRAVATVHGVETYGVRAELAHGGCLAYSADSGPCEALGVLATDADVFVCEAALAVAQPGTEALHLTPTQAAEQARAAGAKRLLLTHVRPDADRAAVAAEAGSVFGAQVRVLLEDDVVEVEGAG